MALVEEVVDEYRNSLVDLSVNSKPLINMLTMLAEDHEQHAPKIVKVIEDHIYKCKREKKLPVLYLIDSIMKNLQKSSYKSLFCKNLVQTFTSVFEQVDEKTRASMYKLRQTWSSILPNQTLYLVDARINKLMDPAWPITATAPEKPSIHVNPRFLSRPSESESSTPEVKEEEAEDDDEEEDPDDMEATMRQQLIAKQQELLKLKQAQLELELAEAQVKMKHQKKKASKAHAPSSIASASVISSLPMPSVQDTLPLTPPTPPEVVPAPRDPRQRPRDPRLQIKEVQPFAHVSSSRDVVPSVNSAIPSHGSTPGAFSPAQIPISLYGGAAPFNPIQSFNGTPGMPPYPPVMGMLPPGHLPGPQGYMHVPGEVFSGEVFSPEESAKFSDEADSDSSRTSAQERRNVSVPQKSPVNIRDPRVAKKAEEEPKSKNSGSDSSNSSRPHKDAHHKDTHHKDTHHKDTHVPTSKISKTDPRNHNRNNTERNNRNSKERDNIAASHSPRKSSSGQQPEKSRSVSKEKETTSDSKLKDFFEAEKRRTEEEKKKPVVKQESKSSAKGRGDSRSKEDADKRGRNSRDRERSPEKASRKNPNRTSHQRGGGDRAGHEERKGRKSEEIMPRDSNTKTDGTAKVEPKTNVQKRGNKAKSSASKEKLKSKSEHTVNKGVEKMDTDQKRQSTGKSNKRDLERRGKSSVEREDGARVTKKLKMDSDVENVSDDNLEEDMDVEKPETKPDVLQDDISELFGSEDQDYRSVDQKGMPLKSPSSKGWDKFKASQPEQFAHDIQLKKQRQEARDVDQRKDSITEEEPQDIDYRVHRQESYPRPEVQRQLSAVETVQIPKELAMGHHHEILIKAHKQLQEGVISHDQHQDLLRQLGELMHIQKLQEENRRLSSEMQAVEEFQNEQRMAQTNEDAANPVDSDYRNKSPRQEVSGKPIPVEVVIPSAPPRDVRSPERPLVGYRIPRKNRETQEGSPRKNFPEVNSQLQNLYPDPPREDARHPGQREAELPGRGSHERLPDQRTGIDDRRPPFDDQRRQEFDDGRPPVDGRRQLLDERGVPLDRVHPEWSGPPENRENRGPPPEELAKRRLPVLPKQEPFSERRVSSGVPEVKEFRDRERFDGPRDRRDFQDGPPLLHPEGHPDWRPPSERIGPLEGPYERRGPPEAPEFQGGPRRPGLLGDMPPLNRRDLPEDHPDWRAGPEHRGPPERAEFLRSPRRHGLLGDMPPLDRRDLPDDRLDRRQGPEHRGPPEGAEFQSGPRRPGLLGDMPPLDRRNIPEDHPDWSPGPEQRGPPERPEFQGGPRRPGLLGDMPPLDRRDLPEDHPDWRQGPEHSGPPEGPEFQGGPRRPGLLGNMPPLDRRDLPEDHPDWRPGPEHSGPPEFQGGPRRPGLLGDMPTLDRRDLPEDHPDWRPGPEHSGSPEGPEFQGGPRRPGLLGDMPPLDRRNLPEDHPDWRPGPEHRGPPEGPEFQEGPRRPGLLGDRPPTGRNREEYPDGRPGPEQRGPTDGAFIGREMGSRGISIEQSEWRGPRGGPQEAPHIRPEERRGPDERFQAGPPEGHPDFRESSNDRRDHPDWRPHDRRGPPPHGERVTPPHDIPDDDRRPPPIQDGRVPTPHDMQEPFERGQPSFDERSPHDRRGLPPHDDRGPPPFDGRSPHDRRGPPPVDLRGPPIHDVRGPQPFDGRTPHDRRGPPHVDGRGPPPHSEIEPRAFDGRPPHDRRGPPPGDGRGPEPHDDRKPPPFDERSPYDRRDERAPPNHNRRGPQHIDGRPPHDIRESPPPDDDRVHLQHDRMEPLPHDGRRLPPMQEGRVLPPNERRPPDDRRGPPPHDGREPLLHNERGPPPHDRRESPMHDERGPPPRDGRGRPSRHGRGRPPHDRRGRPTHDRGSSHHDRRGSHEESRGDFEPKRESPEEMMDRDIPPHRRGEFRGPRGEEPMDWRNEQFEKPPELPVLDFRGPTKPPGWRVPQPDSHGPRRSPPVSHGPRGPLPNLHGLRGPDPHIRGTTPPRGQGPRPMGHYEGPPPEDIQPKEEPQTDEPCDFEPGLPEPEHKNTASPEPVIKQESTIKEEPMDTQPNKEMEKIDPHGGLPPWQPVKKTKKKSAVESKNKSSAEPGKKRSSEHGKKHPKESAKKLHSEPRRNTPPPTITPKIELDDQVKEERTHTEHLPAFLGPANPKPSLPFRGDDQLGPRHGHPRFGVPGGMPQHSIAAGQHMRGPFPPRGPPHQPLSGAPNMSGPPPRMGDPQPLVRPPHPGGPSMHGGPQQLPGGPQNQVGGQPPPQQVEYVDKYGDPRFRSFSDMGPEVCEEVVFGKRNYEIKLGAPPRRIQYGDDYIMVYADPSTRGIVVDGVLLYKFGEKVKEVHIRGKKEKIFYHGKPLNIWIDGQQYEVRVDSPPKALFVNGKAHRIQIDGRDMMILIDKVEKGKYGGEPRFVFIDEERRELRFDPPPRHILIDGKLCELKLNVKQPCVCKEGRLHGIRFDGPPREVFINGSVFTIFTDHAIKIRVGNRFHYVALGGPCHELIVDGKWFEMKFNEQPKEINIGNRVLMVRLPGPPPDVKILPEIQQQLNPLSGPQMSMPPPLLPMGAPGIPNSAMQMGPPVSLPMSASLPMPINMPMTSMPPPVNMLMSGATMIPGLGSSLPVSAAPVNQPSGMPNILSSLFGGPTAAPSIDITSLFSKLVSSGIIKKDPDTMLGNDTAAPASATQSSANPADKKDIVRPPEYADIKKKVVKLEFDNIPDQSELDISKMKILSTGAIQRLYAGVQCTSCGARFMLEDEEKTEEYRQHLDWHFRQNRRGKDDMKVVKYRRWYYGVNDWIQYEEVGDTEDQGRSNFFELQQQNQQSIQSTPASSQPQMALITVPEGASVIKCPAATGSDNDDLCDICHEPFEQYWDEDLEEWHLRDAIKVNDKAYHPICYEDYTDISEGTPSPSVLNITEPDFSSRKTLTYDIELSQDGLAHTSFEESRTVPDSDITDKTEPMITSTEISVKTEPTEQPVDSPDQGVSVKQEPISQEEPFTAMDVDTDSTVDPTLGSIAVKQEPVENEIEISSASDIPVGDISVKIEPVEDTGEEVEKDEGVAPVLEKMETESEEIDVSTQQEGIDSSKDEYVMTSESIPGLEAANEQVVSCEGIPSLETANEHVVACGGIPGLESANEHVMVCDGIPGLETASENVTVNETIPGPEEKTAENVNANETTSGIKTANEFETATESIPGLEKGVESPKEDATQVESNVEMVTQDSAETSKVEKVSGTTDAETEEVNVVSNDFIPGLEHSVESPTESDATKLDQETSCVMVSQQDTIKDTSNIETVTREQDATNLEKVTSVHLTDPASIYSHTLLSRVKAAPPQLHDLGDISDEVLEIGSNASTPTHDELPSPPGDFS